MPDHVLPIPTDGRLEVARRPRSWVRWMLGVLAVVAMAEGGARLVERTDPPIIRWYDATAQLKVGMMDERKADVVFVGTSMAWQGFVPREFEAASPGSSAFNAGLAGAVPVVMRPWILDQVEPRLSPELVVWGLSSLDFAPAYGEDQLEAYEQAPATKRGPLAGVDRALADVSAFIRLRPALRRPSELAGKLAEATEADIDEAVRITGPDGERLDFEEDVSPERRAVIRARLTGFSPDADDIGALRETVTELARRGVRVVLVELPVPMRFVDLHPNGAADQELTTSTADRLGRELGVDVLHFGDVFGDDAFVDFTHLDQDATLRFTRSFAEALTMVETIPAGSCDDLRIVDELGFPLPISACRGAAG